MKQAFAIASFEPAAKGREELPYGVTAQAWQNQFPATPFATAQKILSKNLPANVEFAPGNSDNALIETDLYLQGSVVRVLEVENMRFMRHLKTIWIDEMKVTAGWLGAHLFERRSGLGTIFLSNLFELAAENGYERIALRAGRDNGPLFWSLHGFGFEDEGAMHRSGFRAAVTKAANTLESTGKLPASIADEARAIANAPYAPLSNARVATIPHLVDGVPAGRLLLEGLHEFNAVARLNDPETAAYIAYTATRAEHYALRLGTADAVQLEGTNANRNAAPVSPVAASAARAATAAPR